MKLDLSAFKGIAPRLAEHLLPDGAAVAADNCRLLRGSVGPWWGPLEHYTPDPPSTWPPYQSLYRYQVSAQRDTPDAYWLTWLEDVDVVQTPIPNDQYDRVYFTGTDRPRVTSSDLVAVGDGAYPRSSYWVGVPAPTITPALTVTGTPSPDPPDLTTGISRTCVLTFINSYGEESAPSAASNTVTVYPGESVEVSGLVDFTGTLPYATTYRPLASKCVYLSNTGSSGTQFQKVATLEPATETTTVAYEFTAFGEVLDTDGWLPPPTDLVGIVALPSGALAGFSPNTPLGGSGNTVYLSVPYQAHAWPLAYAFSVSEQIVALAAVGTAVLVLTEGLPTIASGNDPASMAIERLERGYACSSRRGVTTVNGTVTYPSPQGLVAVSPSGTQLLTESLMTAREWADFYPATLHGHGYTGHYVGFFDSSYSPIDGYGPTVEEGGVTWTPRAVPLELWSGIAYGAGRFVAVSNGVTPAAMYSTDGVSWTTSNPILYNLGAVTYGDDLFVAVCGAGPSNGVVTSPDGVSWTRQTAPAGQWWSVAYGGGIFLALGSVGVMTSPDGVVWTLQTWPGGVRWDAVAYGAGIFVAVQGGTEPVPRAMYSTDGVSWTITDPLLPRLNGITYGDGLFVAVSAVGATSNYVTTSPDGITWTARAAPAGVWVAVAYGAGIFVAVAGSEAPKVMTSPNGIDWTLQPVVPNWWGNIAYGDGLFVAVRWYGDYRVMTSPALFRPRDTGALRGGLVFNLTSGQLTTLSGLDATGGHSYPDGDSIALHIIPPEPEEGDPALDSYIALFDADPAAELTYDWKSKPYLTGYEVSMGALRVYAAAYPVTVKVWVNGVLGHTATVSSEEPVRLPATLLGRRWQVEITGTAEVYQVFLATSISELGEDG